MLGKNFVFELIRGEIPMATIFFICTSTSLWSQHFFRKTLLFIQSFSTQACEILPFINIAPVVHYFLKDSDFPCMI